jgi:SH3 domain protein
MLQLRPLAILVLAFSGLGTVDAQTVGYVTDQLRLEARSGPSTGHRIVRMLESGTQIAVLEKQGDYSRIRMPGGSEAWILNRYLMDEPAGRNEVVAARQTLVLVNEENTKLKSELDQSMANGRRTEQERSSLAQVNDELQRELSEIKKIAGSTLEINQLNEELQIQVVNLERELQLAQQENMAMNDSSDRDWFVTGAGVLVGGMILGLIIPQFRGRRRRGWGEL